MDTADGRRIVGTKISVDHFRTEDFAEELANARDNREIGTTVEFENETARVWTIELAPGERVPFHCHAETYFWICVDPGRALIRRDDGTIETYEFPVGETRFSYLDEDNALIHDLENVGDSPMRFVTVELLQS